VKESQTLTTKRKFTKVPYTCETPNKVETSKSVYMRNLYPKNTLTRTDQKRKQNSLTTSTEGTESQPPNLHRTTKPLPTNSQPVAENTRK